eukprot:1115425-Lingulodinium_polyedra.AAC.1
MHAPELGERQRGRHWSQVRLEACTESCAQGEHSAALHVPSSSTRDVTIDFMLQVQSTMTR